MDEASPKPQRSHTHSRVINGVKYIWDVYQLWELAKGLPETTVEVASFNKVIDQDCWFGTTHVPTIRAVTEHCKRINNADLSIPVILDADGSLMDGGHRVAKALINGIKTIKAVRFPIQPPPLRTEPIGSAALPAVPPEKN